MTPEPESGPPPWTACWKISDPPQISEADLSPWLEMCSPHLMHPVLCQREEMEILFPKLISQCINLDLQSFWNPFRQRWHLQSSFWRVQFPGEGGWTPPGSCLQRRKGIRIFASIMLSIWDFNESLSSFFLYCFFQCHSSVNFFFSPLSFPLHFNASVLKGVFANWALKLQGTTSPESFPPGVCWTCRLVCNTPKPKQSAQHPTLTLPA